MRAQEFRILSLLRDSLLDGLTAREMTRRCGIGNNGYTTEFARQLGCKSLGSFARDCRLRIGRVLLIEAEVTCPPDSRSYNVRFGPAVSNP